MEAIFKDEEWSPSIFAEILPLLEQNLLANNDNASTPSDESNSTVLDRQQQQQQQQQQLQVQTQQQENADGNPETGKRKRGNKIPVQRACVPCFNAKRSCSCFRPCERCSRLGLDEQCVDHIPKKRGPYKKRNTAAQSSIIMVQLPESAVEKPLSVAPPPICRAISKGVGFLHTIKSSFESFVTQIDDDQIRSQLEMAAKLLGQCPFGCMSTTPEPVNPIEMLAENAMMQTIMASPIPTMRLSSKCLDEGTSIFFNMAFTRFWGVHPDILREMFVTNSLPLYLHPFDVGKRAQVMNDCIMSKGPAYCVSVRAVRADGTPIELTDIVKLEYDGRGMFAHATIMTIPGRFENIRDAMQQIENVMQFGVQGPSVTLEAATSEQINQLCYAHWTKELRKAKISGESSAAAADSSSSSSSPLASPSAAAASSSYNDGSSYLPLTNPQRSRIFYQDLSEFTDF